MAKLENPLQYFNDLEKRARYKLIKRYDKPLSYHDVKMINDILYNEKTHYVEAFKEYLIYEDYNEFLKRYYKSFELKIKLPKILIFYEKYSKIYANYTVIPESKYMYKNIKRKQKMIDQMQNNDINNSDNEEEEEENEEMSNTVFSSTIMNSIFNKTLSTLNKSNIDGNSEQSINNFLSQINNIENNANNLNKIIAETDGKSNKKYQKNIILPFKINKKILTNNTTNNNKQQNQKNRIQINKNEFLNNRMNNNTKSKNLDVQFTYSKKSFLNEINTNNDNNSNNNKLNSNNSNYNNMAYINEYMSKKNSNNNNSIFNINNSLRNNTNNSNTFHSHQNSLQINNFAKQKIKQNIIKHSNIVNNNIKENMSESNINNYFSNGAVSNLKTNHKYKLSLGETLLKKEKIVLSTNTSGSNIMKENLFPSPNSRDNILVNKKRLLLKEKLIEKGYFNQGINNKLNQKKLKPNLLMDYNSARNNCKFLENQNYTNINNNLNKFNNKKKIFKKVKDVNYLDNNIYNNPSNKEKDKFKDNKENYVYSEIHANINIKKPESHRNYYHSKILSNNAKNKIMSNTNKAFKITVGLKQDLSQSSKKAITTRCSPNSSSSNFYYNSHNNKNIKKNNEKNIKNTLEEYNKKKVVNYNIINNIQDNSTQINIYTGSDLYKSLHFHNNSVFNAPNLTPSGVTFSRSPVGGVKNKKNIQPSNYFKSQIKGKEKNKYNLNLKKMIHRRILESEREKGLISERLMTHNKILEKLERYFLKNNNERMRLNKY